MDLETVLRPNETYVRLYETSWIFKVLHFDLTSHKEPSWPHSQ